MIGRATTINDSNCSIKKIIEDRKISVKMKYDLKVRLPLSMQSSQFVHGMKTPDLKRFREHNHRCLRYATSQSKARVCKATILLLQFKKVQATSADNI